MYCAAVPFLDYVVDTVNRHSHNLAWQRCADAWTRCADAWTRPSHHTGPFRLLALVRSLGQVNCGEAFEVQFERCSATR